LDHDKAFLRRLDSSLRIAEAYKALLPGVNIISGGTAGLRNALRSSYEETFEAASEIKQGSRKDRTNALKNKKPRARIDVSVSLTLKSEAKRNKKH
jgi:hypothetical protein